MRGPCAGHVPNRRDLSFDACLEAPKGELNGRVDRVHNDLAGMLLDLQHEPKQAVGGAVSRSEIFTKAVRQFLMKSRGAEITASYDAAFAQDAPGSEKDKFRRAATRTALLDVEWEEA